MSLSQRREKLKWIETAVGNFFSKIPLLPNHYTLLSLFFAFFTFYFLLKNQFLSATVFYALAIFLDYIDGALARFKSKATKIGAFLDTVCDRYVEGMVLLGFLFTSLPRYFLKVPTEVWIFLALFGSLMTTYVKAAAKEKEITKEEFKKGWFGRPERVILVLLSLALGIFNASLVLYPIMILAIISNLAVFQRIFLAISLSKKEEKT